MENYNAILIEQNKAMSERIIVLRELAVKQINTLAGVDFEKLQNITTGNK